MRAEAERRIGPWSLHEKLGSGGNATVWAASRGRSEERVALKVVNTRKVEREPYQRFVREIEFLRRLTNTEGVLQLIDAHLPERPSEDRPWLAMPIAKPITKALAGAPLDRVVEAMSEIAATLARLQADHGVAHRDIKPGNLYELDGQWLVGDFGLIAAPDLEELTQSGRPLGPAHFTPYEMIRDPLNADPHRADAYSFAKTLWVLATDQRFPPEGHQPAGTRGFSITDFRPHPHTSTLDQLVDVATRIHSEERPTKAQIASDLQAWLALPTQPVTLDVSQVRARLRAKMERELAEEDLEEQRKNQAHSTVRRLQELTRPLNDALKSVHPRTEIDVMDDRATQNYLRSDGYAGAPDVLFRWQRCSRIGLGPAHTRYLLRFGRSLELTEEGHLIFKALIEVGHDSFGGNDFHWQSDPRTAPVGSIQAERMLEEGVAELRERLQAALEVFVEQAPARMDGSS